MWVYLKSKRMFVNLALAHAVNELGEGEDSEMDIYFADETITVKGEDKATLKQALMAAIRAAVDVGLEEE